MEFDFNEDKNDLLFKNRGISFYNVIEAIAENGILANIDHPNKKKYPNQKMFIVQIEQYTYCIPYVIKGNKYF